MTSEGSSFALNLSSILIGDGDLRSRHVSALHRYFGAAGHTAFDGARFHSYARTGHDEFVISPADLIAVTLLSMEIRHNSLSGIATSHAIALEAHRATISELLCRVPSQLDLHSLSDREFDLYLGDTSPALELWRFLRTTVGMHRVATFKLLARKRPRLLPIADSRTERLLGRQDNWWRSWHRALTTRPDLVEELEAIRHDAAEAEPAIREVSLLRVADIALWSPGA